MKDISTPTKTTEKITVLQHPDILHFEKQKK
jgi:hypothetical protein